MKNYGINLEKEKLEQDGTEYIFGAYSSPCITDIKEEEREQYLPKGERQDIGEEKMDCATRAPINKLELKFNWLLKNKKLLPENEQWLRENGYITENGIEFSDRFNATLSGTTREGNSLKAPLQSIHEDGLIPKFKLPQAFTFTEHTDKSAITGSLRALGQQFLSRFKINYEKVLEVHYKELLKEDMLDVAGFAWPTPENGEYPKVDNSPNHAFLVYKTPAFYAFDNYEEAPNDYIKKLKPDYDFFEYGYRVYISAQYLPSNKNWLAEILSNIWQIFFSIKEKAEELPKMIPPVPTKPEYLTLMCEGIKEHEGWFPNSRSFRNKNPGNLRKGQWSLAIGYDKDSFAIFKTEADGMTTLKNMIKNAASGQSKVYKPTDSLVVFFKKFAPSSDNNNPEHYASVVGKKMGVNHFTFTLKDLLS